MNKIKAIRTDDDYQAALELLEVLIDHSPEPDSEESDQLEVLSVLIDNYESKLFPAAISSPVEAIEFAMEQKGLKRVDLVPYLGSESRVSEILSGKRTLSLDMIRSLEHGLGIPAKILVRKPEENEEAILQSWDKKLFKEMESRGYFNPEEATDDKTSVLKNFFGGFSVAPAASALLRQSSYRSAPTTDVNALIAWSKKVLNEANKFELDNTYTEGSVDLDYMKNIVKLSVAVDGPLKAKKKLQDTGIILIIEPHLPKTRLDGSVLMLNNSIPVIGMTLRHDRVDNFWFTLMHELAHISLHLNKVDTDSFFDELDDIKGSEIKDIEKEADTMASEALIPENKWAISPAKLIPSPLAAKSLANDVGVDISIVAGKIRYESGNWNYLNSLISGKTVSELLVTSREDLHHEA